MKPKVYIDGKSGTTGLQIYDRLGAREDIELLTISEELHRDVNERARLMNEADLVFLCLPDAAAIEAVGLITNPNTRVIDTSTAHRTNPSWDYGFPEIAGADRDKLINSKRVANPGCHATGFISIVKPLVELGIIGAETPVTAWSLTGYSGGGKNMIAQYESEDKTEDLYAPRQYGLNGNHKHIPEMQKICGLSVAPIFNPIVDDYYKGMQVSVPLHKQFINGLSAEQIKDMLFTYYRNTAMVSVHPEVMDAGFISANEAAGKDNLTIYVCGNDDRVTITAIFDNLGKGASGAAVQNMNLMFGFNETESLHK
ncbi:MAG: N-acetyl-gamma-glutamyl-phosphate reductase [Clostridia bacterium]|nr:N-acetyl-gamma-glutamyl-phosphate reductase [Clostridia bacterium]